MNDDNRAILFALAVVSVWASSSATQAQQGNQTSVAEPVQAQQSPSRPGGRFASLSPDQKQALMKRLMQRRAQNRQASPPGSSRGAPANIDDVVIKSDIAYGTSPLQKLDLYTPKRSTEPLPIVIFVHGGGWTRGDKAQGDRKDKGCAYVDHGVIFISVNYRLAPNVMHPEQVRDIASAFAWAKTHAGEFGGNPGRIFLMGHSAGAHLVDLLGTNERFLAEKGLGLKDVAGVISLDTASLNLQERKEGGESALVGPMIDTAFGSDPKVLKDGSPTLAITKGKSYPPFLMFCGSKRLGCVAQHKEFSELLKGVGGKVTVKAIPLSHGDINKASGQPDNDVFKDCMELIKGQ